MENAMAFACPLCKFVLPAVSAVALIAVAGVVAQQEGTKDAPKEAPAAETAKVDPYVLGHVVKDIDGKTVDLSAYKGQVVVIVNVASKCGFTKQYTGLEALYQAKKAQGLVILGFPANNFGGQEPGTNAEIKEFCTGAESKYKVTFPLFEKISVKGEDIHPLYKQLATQPAPIGGDVGWNFTKYLVDREGKVVAKFDSRTKPDDAAMNKRIDELLGAAKAAPAEKPAGGS
jgi:glutathione peroxidase